MKANLVGIVKSEFNYKVYQVSLGRQYFVGYSDDGLYLHYDFRGKALPKPKKLTVLKTDTTAWEN